MKANERNKWLVPLNMQNILRLKAKNAVLAKSAFPRLNLTPQPNR